MVHISLKAEEIFRLGGLSVTNTLLLSVTAAVIIAAIAILSRRSIRIIPGMLQNVIEFVIEELLRLMDSVLGERKKSEKYLPLVATIFVFILFSNWLGLMPGIGSIGLQEHKEFIPLFRSPASDLNFTLALALITVICANILGILAIGARAHLSKFFNFKSPVGFFIGTLELVSEFAKIVSFSFRLFGNVFAGEVLLVVAAFLIPYVIPLPFLFLELFVGFIQAFIFAMLSLVFTAIATAEHEEAH
ncbi:MAG: F0F1 ATP synthase subunit A [Candidatus Liptonbacteria bacterium]|nr:F0F1 ATP synthase subunit A [Candidatus Liptonbacteria bacterium]